MGRSVLSCIKVGIWVYCGTGIIWFCLAYIQSILFLYNTIMKGVERDLHFFFPVYIRFAYIFTSGIGVALIHHSVGHSRGFVALRPGS